MGKTLKRIDGSTENWLRTWAKEIEAGRVGVDAEEVEHFNDVLLETIVKPHRFGSDVSDRRGCVKHGDTLGAKRLGKRSLYRALRSEGKRACLDELSDYAFAIEDDRIEDERLMRELEYESMLEVERVMEQRRAAQMAANYGMSITAFLEFEEGIDWSYVGWCEKQLECETLSLLTRASYVRSMYMEMFPEHIFLREWFEWLCQPAVTGHAQYPELADKYAEDLVLPLAA